MDIIFEALLVTTPWTFGGVGIFVVIILLFSRKLESGILDAEDWEKYKDRYVLHRDEIVAENKGAIDMASTALRGAIILNGTAAAATLAFIGRIWGEDNASCLVPNLVAVFAVFITGAFSSSIATAFGYLRMYFGTLNWEVYKKNGGNSNYILNAAHIVQGIAFFLVVESYALFGYAVSNTIDAMR